MDQAVEQPIDRTGGRPAGDASSNAGPTAEPNTGYFAGRFAWIAQIRVHHILVAAFLITYPLAVGEFWAVQIGAQILIYGVIALSLMFLAGYGGMVSLAQMTIAGFAGYLCAIFGVNSAGLGLGWPWWAAVAMGLGGATLFATLIGWISVRTEGIYTIMITLAIGVAFFYFARQNYAIFNGFNGFAGLKPPVVFGVNWRDPTPFYFLTLAVAGLAYFGALYLSRSTFGLSLQAIRDNPRRMNALGFNVKTHRILAYTAAGFIAGLGGLEWIWLNDRISPGTISVGPLINILVIAVLGGLRHPVGPFLGAIVFVLLQNFAIDLIDRERFNTVIGATFLLIVLFSPDGLLGLWSQLKARLGINRVGPSDADQQYRTPSERQSESPAAVGQRFTTGIGGN
jgi:branched-chain amino acid transport system permease protein